MVRLYQVGKYPEAILLAERALAIREIALGPDHPDVATTLNNLSQLFRAVEARLSRVTKKLAHYRKEARALRSIEARMNETGETQVSLTDPDCRAMATTSKQPRIVGYNVQSAVETKHHLIVAHEVTNLGYDRDALSMMALKARDEMASDTIEAIADKGYYKGEEIVACELAGIAVTVAKPHTSNAAAVGRFDRADFVYDETKTLMCARPVNGSTITT